MTEQPASTSTTPEAETVISTWEPVSRHNPEVDPLALPTELHPRWYFPWRVDQYFKRPGWFPCWSIETWGLAGLWATVLGLLLFLSYPEAPLTLEITPAQMNPQADSATSDTAATVSTDDLGLENPLESTASPLNSASLSAVAGKPVRDLYHSASTQTIRPAKLPPKVIHINTASLADFQRMPGVGPKLAQRIIATRKQIGGFKSPQDLDQVPGIGPKKLAKMLPYLRI